MQNDWKLRHLGTLCLFLECYVARSASTKQKIHVKVVTCAHFLSLHNCFRIFQTVFARVFVAVHENKGWLQTLWSMSQLPARVRNNSQLLTCCYLFLAFLLARLSPFFSWLALGLQCFI